MENFIQDEMKIISLNVAGWNWKVTNENWVSRFTRICEHIKNNHNPFIIALQEVQLSGGKYLSILEKNFPDYHIVLPKAYNVNKQPRSVISLLLINKALCESYNVRTLTGLENSLRYNFVHIDTTNDLCFRVLNTNVPHNCFGNAAEWYRNERKALRTLFINNIKELADTYRLESDLKLIVLGDFNSTPNSEFIKLLAYTHDRPMIDAVKEDDKYTTTWKNSSNTGQNRLDYILYSTGMLCDTGVRAKFTCIDENTIHQNLSDHALLVGGLIA